MIGPAQFQAFAEKLKAEIEQAQASGEHAALFRLADRLLALDDGGAGIAYLFRAAALEGLGDAAGARRDLLAGFRVAPEIESLARGVMAFLQPAERREAIVLRLAAGSEPDSVMFSMLLTEGFDALVVAGRKVGTIEGRAWWRGSPSLRLKAMIEGIGDRVLDVMSAGPRAGLPFDHHASFTLPVPFEADLVRLESLSHRALAVPQALLPDRAPRLSPLSGNPGRLMVLVPAYRDWPSLERCLDSVEAALEPGMRLVVVDDASPDATLSEKLRERATGGRLTLLRNQFNLGFSGSVNRGLHLRLRDEDVLILNSDATLPPGALARLERLARSRAALGTLTPLSNNGEDCSVPEHFRVNPEPDDALLARLDAAAAAASGDRLIPLVNGVGFCLYVRGPVFDAIGGFSGAFERGYFEDVDFCLRAASAGFQNACAPGVYVAHAGSRSFGSDRQALIRRNLPRVVERHPDYLLRSKRFVESHPYAGLNAAMARAYLLGGPPAGVIVTPRGCPAIVAQACIAPARAALQVEVHGASMRFVSLDPAYPFNVLVEPGTDRAVLLAHLAKGQGWRLAFDGTTLDRHPAFAHWPVVSPEAPSLEALPEGLAGAVGILAPTLTKRSERDLRALAARRSGLRLVLLDPVSLAREVPLLLECGILGCGPIERDGLEQWLENAGIRALLAPDRIYGRFDPRIGPARERGLRTYRLSSRTG
ncbi:MAG: glycosyltransferase [Beijerinckiaceae bacterium]|nr:glycosyltransferase [Beijerinckiaceae bacterium]MCZ8298790.1 glycosyltransferase [Beijerinckiaceae bacterium]